MKNYEFIMALEGYYTISNPPSVEDLKQYYQNKYWQEVTGLGVNMTEIERAYIANTVKLKGYNAEKFLKSKNRFLDIGAGEGHTLNYFTKKGWYGVGLDFSDYGVRRHYPELLPNLIIGDIYENLNLIIEKEEKFNLVILDNVLEHVISPKDLISNIKKIMIEEEGCSSLLVRVPNDFSAIQSYLSSRNIVNNKYWISPPDHLNYFNAASLQKFFIHNGFIVDVMYSDWPIELDLFNPNTNYVNNKQVGKDSHIARMVIENLIAENEIEDVMKFYEAAAKVGLGRTITIFAHLI